MEKKSTIATRLLGGIVRELDMYLHLSIGVKILFLFFLPIASAVIFLRIVMGTCSFIYNETMYAIERRR